MSRTARIRLLAATAFVAFLVLVGLLLSIPFLVSDPVVVVRPGSAPALLSGEGFPVAAAQIQVGARGEFMLYLTFEQATDDALRVAVRMPGHGMATPSLEVRAIGGSRFQAVGQLTMPGRWEIEVEFGELGQSFDFILAEF
ncbi:hypothetical protein [Manganibacter manganicus]|nr:hypothetical protein [Pseudaminobacter manganicus]